MARALRVLPGDVAGPPAEGIEVAYADRDGPEFRLPVADTWAMRFEDVAPRSYKGQQHLPGLWWPVTVGGHIGYVASLKSSDSTCA